MSRASELVHANALTINSLSVPIEEKRGHESRSVGYLSSLKIRFGMWPVNDS